MSLSPEKNLDYLAAKHAQEIVKEGADENTLTKALGVLQEQGVYACFLYLRTREENGGKIIAKMRALLDALGVGNTSEDDLEYGRQLTANLPTLLLAKEALEQMLIYARYGAKARS